VTLTRRVRRRLAGSGALAVAAVVPLLLTTAVGPGASATAARQQPRITHVWNIVLENEDYATTFGTPSSDPYLAKTLVNQGALLTNYYGTGHESNDNYLSLVSGQPPNIDTQSDCQVYTPVVGYVNKQGIDTGVGCVYPTSVPTIGNQLTAKGLTWKAYEQDMGDDPSREAAACGHPTLYSRDGTQSAEASDGYASRHDPFVYFSAVTSNTTYCDQHVVSLGSTSGALPKGALKGETGLATDLKSVKTTPSYSFITPNLCSDGHDYPCTNTTSGASAGSALGNIDAFLATWVPRITASPAYKQGGLIEITFDESDGPQSDSSACCGETLDPDLEPAGITGPGGGKIGAVLLSPYIRGGTKVTTAYNHYSTLALDEEIFGLSRLGEAASASVLQTPTISWG
jgi:phosphatidylinositol-3-phosphatase